MKTSHKFVLQSMFIMAILAMGSTPVVTADYTTGNNNLTDALNASLHNIIDSGDYDAIYGDWFDGAVVLTDDSDANTATTFPDEKDLDKNGTLERIIEAGEILFGSDTTYPPFEYIESGSVVIGFDADIAEAIAAELSTAYDTTIVAVMQTNDWDPIIPDLKTGKFDALISAMTKTAVRAQEIDFTRSYYTSKQAILAGANAPTVTGIADLNAVGIKIAVQTGTTSDIYAAANLGDATVSGFTGFDEAVLALKNGDVDFLLGDLPVLAFYAVDNPTDSFSVVGSFGDDELFG
ncbi:MAG: transporter substrate-binding domain-containing protein, partial [Candidatus Heimdallarchaeota archaeon]|nr:transporter substrate-binding domain-containing protein [Candidatus Heimdallarchaeota archaeon]